MNPDKRNSCLNSPGLRTYEHTLAGSAHMRNPAVVHLHTSKRLTLNLAASARGCQIVQLSFIIFSIYS